MFYFNFGCIVSLLTLEFTKSGMKFTIPPVRDLTTRPIWVGYGLLLAIEIFHAIPLLKEYNRSWEYLDWKGYRRFPMTTPLILAWGFLSQMVGVFALCGSALIRPNIWNLNLPPIIKRIGEVIASIYEHFGANVLLYLTVSNFVIHGFFHIDWRKFFSKVRKTDAQPVFTNFQWELMVVVVAIAQILLVRLLVYLVRSSRK
jgi:hypothetical protein